MNRLPIIAVLGTAIALAGCVVTVPTVPGPPVPPAPPAGSCTESSADIFVGQRATPNVLEAARLAANAVTVRTIAPGQVVTMEFNGSRLTLDVDYSGFIVDGRCG